MGKFEKHIGKGEIIEIDGEEFVLKPLGIEFIPEFFKAMRTFSGAKVGATPEEALKNIDQQGLEAIQKIIEATLKRSFPDEPEEDRKIFGMRYMSILFPKIIEMNSAPQPTDIGAIKKAQAIERLQTKNDTRPDQTPQG